MSRRLILLRHGQTGFNAESRMQGQLDTDLTDLGRAGASSAADMLVDANISRIISSDLTRAAETAQAVSGRLGVPVTHDARLRETHLGDWQGLTHAEVDSQYPGSRDAWRANASWAPPQGESRIDVARRARPVVAELEADDSWQDSSILLVAHGGTIAALTGNLLGFDVSMYPLLTNLDNTHFGVLDTRANQPGWFLKGWNVGEVAW